MPPKVARVDWRCKRCGKRQWLKPHTARRKVYCSRACLHASLRAEKPVREKQSAKPTYGERDCEVCGSTYVARNKIQRYCSQPCALRAIQLRNQRKDVTDRPCEVCGKVFRPRPGSAGRFCSRSCNYAGQRGARSALWRGGRHVTAEGYVRVQAPGHPVAHGKGGYVSEHRLVMEQKLGRYLEPGETVHHINGDRADNRPENLQLRSGRHGNGFVHECADCGSRNVRRVPID